MTERIKRLLERTFVKEQEQFRRDVDWSSLLARFAEEQVGDEARARIGLEEMLKAETPQFMEGETISFMRTVRQIPELHTKGLPFGPSIEVITICKNLGFQLDEDKKVVPALFYFNIAYDLTHDPAIKDVIDDLNQKVERRLNE